MKQLQAEKYNIAWFKLAECISRREKERALGVYRLLSHSFENEAVVYQLEGDILLAFNEREAALEQYEKAAQTYQKQNQLMQAIAIYDHLLTLVDDERYLKKMIDLYAQLSEHQRMFTYIKRLGHLLVKKQELTRLLDLLKTMQINMQQKAALLIELTIAVLPDSSIDQQIKYQLIQQTLDRLMHDTHSLQSFMKKLQALDELCYLFACEYLQKD